jgi:hypothetical protein
MEVYISINGVLRNFIQKFEYHYKSHFLETELDDEVTQEETPFEYRINYPIQNDNLLNHYIFESKDEYEYFLFIEFALEIFGYAGISYSMAISDLNKLMYEHKNVDFTIIGLDELGKAKSSTLFFLSKNGFLGDNIKFILSKDIDKEWEKCNMWITDNKNIIDRCPIGKKAIKFNTDYNDYFNYENEINNLNLLKID